MCSLGARKNTQKEMYDVLHLGQNISFDNFKKCMLNLNVSIYVSIIVLKFVMRVFYTFLIIIAEFKASDSWDCESNLC